MNNLYTSLAEVYERMYQTFINYEEEFNFYSEILESNNCTKVLEVGCGTGNLAGRLINDGFEYTGVDLSEDMLSIARRNYSQGEFMRGDMRNFQLTARFQAIILTGRTVSYLLSNKDVHDAFLNFNDHLIDNGIVCFDCIDANKFIPTIEAKKKIVHSASFDGRSFVRESFWSVNFSQSWTFDWHSTYYESINDELKKLGEDKSTIRAFTRDEITLFLKLAGFELIEIQDRPSYAFETFVVVARSIRDRSATT